MHLFVRSVFALVTSLRLVCCLILPIPHRLECSVQTSGRNIQYVLNKTLTMTKCLVLFLLAARNTAMCQYCFYSVVQKIHVAPINVKFGTGERIKGPLPHAKFHVYRGRNVGMQPPKLKILNFGNKFVPQGRLVCTIFTKLSAFVRVYR